MTGVVIIVFNIDCRIFLLQIQAIKKFCKDEFVIEVIDNSTNEEQAEAIRYHAKDQGVNYTKTEPALNDPSTSHAFAANFSYKLLREQYDYFLYLDHDCIPVKEFSVVEILGDKLIAGVLQGQSETKYFWPGCVMWNNKEIDFRAIDFNHYSKLRVDTGGGFYKVIKTYGYDRCILFDEIGCQNPDFQDEHYYFYMMIYNKTFIHWLNTSNWRGVERNNERIGTLMNITLNLIND